MALKEKISKHLGKPYVYLPKYKKFLCSNGVVFTMEEYERGIDINAEYERRAKEDMLYDYVYAKNTGILRKKRGYAKVQEDKLVQQASNEVLTRKEQEVFQKIEADSGNTNLSERSTRDVSDESIQRKVCHSEGIHTRNEGEESYQISRRFDSGTNQSETEGNSRSVFMIVLLLAFTSAISMYISTLHTATYLRDYVEIISAWLMSASITAYNSTAFEVSVIFKLKKRYFLSVIFIFLWTLVTLFSMATTVSVFYDRFNFNELQTAQDNKGFDSAKLELELLQRKEATLRESIDFKKKDIEYRQERDYATTAVRLELADLEKQLQENLEEQKNVLSSTPDIVKEEVKRKESLFAFLGRKLKIEGGILEFIMSTLSAIFINLIAPISMTAVTEIVRKERLTK